MNMHAFLIVVIRKPFTSLSMSTSSFLIIGGRVDDADIELLLHTPDRKRLIAKVRTL